MTTCVKVINLNGQQVFAPAPEITDISTCAYVVQDGATASLGQLLAVTPADAITLSWKIGLVWAVAWAVKVVARSINFSGEIQDG